MSQERFLIPQKANKSTSKDAAASFYIWHQSRVHFFNFSLLARLFVLYPRFLARRQLFLCQKHIRNKVSANSGWELNESLSHSLTWASLHPLALWTQRWCAFIIAKKWKLEFLLFSIVRLKGLLLLSGIKAHKHTKTHWQREVESSCSVCAFFNALMQFCHVQFL